MTYANDASQDLSRVLAALDTPSLSFGSLNVPSRPLSSPLKRKPTVAQLSDSSDIDAKRRVASRNTSMVIPESSGSNNIMASLATNGIGAALAPLNLLGISPTKVSGGFQLNYDNETPLRRIDFGGDDQSLRLAEFVTTSIDNSSHGLTVADALKKLGLLHQKDFLPGLEVRLLPHQLIGVVWMLEQERKTRSKGGILADDMGLGKTVQMIATMAMNVPKPDVKDRTTLIVVPAALLQQWKDEIETKTNGIFTVHIHYGRNKLKTRADLRSKDIIITTYHTLHTDFAIPKDVEREEELEWVRRHGGLLARANFYRVVCDEAQFIRNRSTRSSQSVAMLKAKHRWMLTGTPVTNTLADIYGLLRFGQFRPWNDWNDFNEFIAKIQAKDALLAGERAREILRPLMLRRTKNSKLEGKPILELPPKTIDLITLEFSKEERELYDSFEHQTKIRVGKFIREETLVKNQVIVLVMILRLRQLCCHPNLILNMADPNDDPTLLVASKDEKELGRATKVMGVAWTSAVKKRFLDRALATEAFESPDKSGELGMACPVCQDVYTNNTGRVLACGHELCFDCLLDLSHSSINHDGEFGQGNEQENAIAEKEYETAMENGYRPCPVCKKMMDLTPAKVFRSAAFEPSEEDRANYVRTTRRGKVVTRKLVYDDDDGDDEEDEKKEKEEKEEPHRDSDHELMKGLSDSEDELPEVSHFLRKPTKCGQEADDLPWFQQSAPKIDEARVEKIQMNALVTMWKKGDQDLEPSTKMNALIKLLRKWDKSGDKTICFSQWTSMLDLVEILFSRHGIRSLRYDGKMSMAAKDATLATFRKKGGIKVILVSTKCGGVGLNLVSANRVINLDLSWNYAAESQAYDRVHRLGQEKNVLVNRLVVRDTIEERMLQLQEVKVGLAETALGEGSGGKLHKLSVRDIQHLFGMTKDTGNTAQQGAAKEGES